MRFHLSLDFMNTNLSGKLTIIFYDLLITLLLPASKTHLLIGKPFTSESFSTFKFRRRVFTINDNFSNRVFYKNSILKIETKTVFSLG